MTGDNPRDYVVGYKKPPVGTRFKPGHSGNRKGRPRGARDFETSLEAEFSARIPVTENGQKKKISKRDAMAKQLVNKAVGGDMRAMQMALKELRYREGQRPGEASSGTEKIDNTYGVPLTEEEAARIYAAAIKKTQPDE